MSDTNLYWRLRGTYAERREKLAAFDKSFLEAAILDAEYNEFLSSRADFPFNQEANLRDSQRDRRGHGKRLPYVGWYWRHLEFSDGALPIGDCGQFVGFMANNKWDYPERLTTPEEFACIMAIIDAAMVLNEKGGELTEITDTTLAKLDELWDYLQRLDVRGTGYRVGREPDANAEPLDLPALAEAGYRL